jgi:hypothetical protein
MPFREPRRRAAPVTLHRRQIPQRAVQTLLVVTPHDVIHQRPRLKHVTWLLILQTLPQGPVGPLYQPVLLRAMRVREDAI